MFCYKMDDIERDLSMYPKANEPPIERMFLCLYLWLVYSDYTNTEVHHTEVPVDFSHSAHFARHITVLPQFRIQVPPNNAQ